MSGVSADAIARAWLALDGLSVGDTFGERFFGPEEVMIRRVWDRVLAPPPWSYTDDTEMAISIVEMLQASGTIDQDVLARQFAKRMTPSRVYGQGAFTVLSKINDGIDWRVAAQAAFAGRGSFGNGAAMRVAPLGAFFADQPLATVIEQATLSSEVTHAHDEGIAGGIAVAVAAALAWQARERREPLGVEWLRAVHEATPKGYTRNAIEEAVTLRFGVDITNAAEVLGNGSGVTAPDTVPLCLWVAAQATSFEEALWQTVGALGDRDTTCAIVGGILALKLGPAQIPAKWLESRETLPLSR
jgi:ADP-ribosylglycohydrolase